ncbi:MAG: hypothetical protein DI556_00795 [Rhodovulum sulfidophilum]|uniref:Uncharacterized protein n=1 Tax=Rhodovulum sulfidophilum TaxID=35806 RepID=A0A2W5NNA0_RHOSU|nr:MAG: hypothetical protein DI556_00795 [Rhodovulum sulfidophilum]
MTKLYAGALAALLLAAPALAQTPPPITAPTADPAADAELVACATYLAADNAARMEMLAELDMMAGEGGGKTSANEIAAELATECEATPDSLITEVLGTLGAR